MLISTSSDISDADTTMLRATKDAHPSQLGWSAEAERPRKFNYGFAD